MKIYCYPKCTTCKKALKWLDERGISYELTDISRENPTEEQLRQWYAKSGLPLKKFFNTSGMIYKNMGLSKKLPEMSEDEQLALLATDGMLVKRPLVIDDNFVLTGFREADWEQKMLKNRLPALRGRSCKKGNGGAGKS